MDITTLDVALVDESPSCIKIDVEGFESSVLAGASSVLRKTSVRSVIMELNGSGKRYGFDESKILRLMLDLGFNTYSYNPLKRDLVDLAGAIHPSGNTLFIRDTPLIRDRIRSAPKVAIFHHSF